MIADGDHEGGRCELPIMMGKVESERLLATLVQCVPHPLEVRQAARGEVVSGSSLDIDLMECGEVGGVTAGDLDPGFLRLSNISSP